MLSERLTAARDGNRERSLPLVLGLALCAFAFQQTSVFVLLPALSRSFHATTAWSTWIVTGFLLVGAVATPLIGKLADEYGRGRVLRAAIAVFTLATIGAAATPSLGVLIVFRAVCGVSGVFLAVGVALLGERLPAARVGSGIGGLVAWLAVGNIGAVLLAPQLANAVSWRAVMALDAAPCAAALALSWRMTWPHASRTHPAIDVPGAVLMAIAIASLMLAFTEANVWGWSSAPILGLFGGSLVAGATWVWSELRASHPLVELRVLLRRTVLLTNIAIALAGAAVFTSLVLVARLVAAPRGVPANLVGLVHYGFHASSAGVGLFLFPQFSVAIVVGMMLGPLSRRLGWKAPFVLALAMLAVALIILGRWHAHAWQIVLAMVLAGAAPTLGTVGVKLVADDVSPNEQAVVAGLNTVAYYVGGVVGTQGVAALLGGQLITGTTVPTGSAFATSFYVLAAVVVLSIPLALLVHPRRRASKRVVPRPPKAKRPMTKRLVR